MDNKYHIYKYLDEERRIVGLPMDEFIPISIVLITSFFMKFLLLGILGAGVMFGFMRSLKKNRGRCALLSLIYWNGNDAVCRSLFRSFPSSSQRYWI